MVDEGLDQVEVVVHNLTLWVVCSSHLQKTTTELAIVKLKCIGTLTHAFVTLMPC